MSAGTGGGKEIGGRREQRTHTGSVAKLRQFLGESGGRVIRDMLEIGWRHGTPRIGIVDGPCLFDAREVLDQNAIGIAEFEGIVDGRRTAGLDAVEGARQRIGAGTGTTLDDPDIMLARRLGQRILEGFQLVGRDAGQLL